MSSDLICITGAQIRAARGMVRWSARQLAEKAGLGLATVQRAEAVDGEPPTTGGNQRLIRQALEAAGVEFIEENGGGPGVRMRKQPEEPIEVSSSPCMGDFGDETRKG